MHTTIQIYAGCVTVTWQLSQLTCTNILVCSEISACCELTTSYAWIGYPDMPQSCHTFLQGPVKWTCIQISFSFNQNAVQLPDSLIYNHLFLLFTDSAPISCTFIPTIVRRLVWLLFHWFLKTCDMVYSLN